MSDNEMESVNAFSLSEEKISHFTQTGALSEPSLGQLRDQIKKVMIPLLIKTFQYKLELSQSSSMPSRLKSSKDHLSLEEIKEQLSTLDSDLKVLLLWCQSCRSQIQKALTLPDEEQKKTVASSATSAHPAVAKSFSEAISANSSFFQQQSSQENREHTLSNPSGTDSQKTWWEKLLGQYTEENDHTRD